MIGVEVSDHLESPVQRDDLPLDVTMKDPVGNFEGRHKVSTRNC